MFLRKFYIGFFMFLINFFVFFLLSYIDRVFESYVLLSVYFFLVLFFVIFASKEILDVANKKKTSDSIQKIIIVVFLVLFFLFFLFFLLNFFASNEMITSKIKKTFLFQKILLNFYKYSFFVFCLLIFGLLIFFLFKNSFKTQNLMHTLLSLLYVAFFSACFLSLLFLNIKWFLYILLITVLSDSFSFLGGRFFGKYYLYPSLSPHKTWEGFFCGIFTSFIFILIIFGNLHNPYYHYFIFFTFVNVILSQLGDLVASKMKRDFQIKDFGHLFPEHGGLLDRFDSLLFLSFFVVLILSIPSDFRNQIFNFINH